MAEIDKTAVAPSISLLHRVRRLLHRRESVAPLPSLPRRFCRRWDLVNVLAPRRWGIMQTVRQLPGQMRGMAHDSPSLERLKARLSRFLRLIDDGDPGRLAAIAIGIGFALTFVAVLSFVLSKRGTPRSDVDSSQPVVVKEPRLAAEASATSPHWIAKVLRPGDGVIVARREQYNAPSNQPSWKPYKITHWGSVDIFQQVEFIAGSSVKLVSGEAE